MSEKNLSRRKTCLLLDGWQIFINLYFASLLYKEKKNRSKFQLITTTYESKTDDHRVQGVVTSCYFHTQQLEISINIRIIECARG